MIRKSVKKGMTLVELMVAIAIVSLGMSVFTLLSIKAWSYKGYALEQATETASASKVISQMVHEIRTARQAADGSYAIKEAKDNSLIIYRDEDEDGKPERVHYFLVDDKLKKGVTTYDISTNSYASEDQTVKTLLNYVTNKENEEDPLFLYYDNGFNFDHSHEMESALPYDVRLIRIHLWVNVKPIVAPENVNLEGVAELRNLNEY